VWLTVFRKSHASILKGKQNIARLRHATSRHWCHVWQNQLNAFSLLEHVCAYVYLSRV